MLDDGCGQVRGQRLEKLLHDPADARHAHVDHQRRAGRGDRRDRAPIRPGGPGSCMAGDQQRRLRPDAPVRPAHPERGCRAEARGDAVDDVHLQTRRVQRLDLLAGAPEDQRIAALEPDDLLPGQGLAHHELLDELLRRRRAAPALAHVDDARPRLASLQRRLEHLLSDQVVDEDDRRGAQHAKRLQGEQLGIAGAGADQVDRMQQWVHDVVHVGFEGFRPASAARPPARGGATAAGRSRNSFRNAVAPGPARAVAGERRPPPPGRPWRRPR